MHKWILTAITLIGATFYAADVPVELGTVTIPDASLDKAMLWLDAQPNLYTNTTVVTTNDVGGSNLIVTNTVAVVIPETPKVKATRTMRRIAREAILKDVRAYLARLKKLELDRDAIIEGE